MTSSSADAPNGEKCRQEACLCCSGSLWLAAQFLLKWLTCQSGIDPESRAEGDKPRCSVSRLQTFLGIAPPDRGQVGWSRINHSLFPLSPGLGEVASKGAPHTFRHTHIHTGHLSSFSSTLSIFLSLPNLLLCLSLWPVCWCSAALHKKWGFTLCKTWSSQHAEC